MVVHPEDAADRSGVVRRALQLNAVSSAISGSLIIFGAGPVSRFLGLDSAWIAAGIGAGVLLWAGFAFMASRETPVDPGKVKEIIAGDLAWVVASVLVIISGWPELTSAGRWAVAVAADAVLIFAILQYLGLRRLR